MDLFKTENKGSIMTIDNLLAKLQEHKSIDVVENMYKDSAKVKNIKMYIDYIMAHHKDNFILFVGEAGGYLGMAQTGIGFTSPYQLEIGVHPVLDELLTKIAAPRKYSKGENTAKAFWKTMSDYNIVPLPWNTYPFHPHDKGSIATNRKPTTKEADEGVEYTKELISITNPKLIVAVGKVASNTLTKHGIVHSEVRHPSYGGIPEFRANLKTIMVDYLGH